MTQLVPPTEDQVRNAYSPNTQPPMTRVQSAYDQWHDALYQEIFDVAALRTIHEDFQAKLIREREWREIWDACDAQHTQETIALKREIKNEYSAMSKRRIYQALSDAVRHGIPYDRWTKEEMIAHLVRLKCDMLTGVHTRAKAEWVQRHPEDPK